MSPAWAQARLWFDRLAELSAAERKAVLARGGLEAALAAEVSQLLAQHDAAERHGSVLNQPLRWPLGHTAERSGQRLGPWELVSCLGSGGMGEVWSARRIDGRYEARAAVKMLRHGMDSASVLRRFALERQALARLSHPHIARLLDAGATEDGAPYFVLEQVDGKPLREAVVGLGLDERLALFLQLADAVAHAHRNLLVHRDLKPGNVLVDAEGRVKLLDFGIAKLIDPLEHADGDITLAGARPFTPNYASPEQVRGEPVGTPTDVYSLGVLLYELMTGLRPTGRRAATTADAVQAVLTEAPAVPSRLGAESAVPWIRRLAGDLDQIVLKALEKEPSARYASVDALATDLRAYRAGRPVSARAATPAYVIGKFVRRNRWPVLAASLGATGLAMEVVATVVQGRAAAALGVLGLAVGLGLALWQGRRAEMARERAEGHVADLRRLGREVVLQYGDAITHLPGGKARKAAMLTATAELLERLMRIGGADQNLWGELGVIDARLADLYSSTEFNPVHDRQAAERYAKRAIPLCEAAESAGVADASLYRWWARATSVLGEVAQDLRSELPQALALLQAADTLSERGLARFPQDVALRHGRGDNQLQIVEVHFGWNRSNLGLPDEALVWIDRARAQYAAEVGADGPAAAYAAYQTGTAEGARALIHARFERWEAALAAAQTACALRAQASRLEPFNAMYKGAEAAECNLVGGLHLNVGDAAGALVATTRAWGLLEDLLAAEPAHDSWTAQRRSLAFNHGRALLGAGQAAAAKEILQVSADWLEGLMAAGQAKPAHRRRLALTWLAQAQCLRERGDDGLALAARAWGLLESCVAADPGDRDAWLALGEAATVQARWGGEVDLLWKARARDGYARAAAGRPLTAVHARHAAWASS